MTDDESIRAVKCLYTRTNLLFKQNDTVRYCNNNIRKIMLSAFGNIYGIETFEHITTRMTNAHRYLTKSLFS